MEGCVRAMTMDERDKAVMEAIISEGGNFTHVGMWYLQGIQEHKMLRVNQKTGKLDHRENITRLADKLHEIIYKEKIKP